MQHKLHTLQFGIIILNAVKHFSGLHMQGLVAQLEDRYKQVWRAHSSATQAGKLRPVPITVSKDYIHSNVAPSGITLSNTRTNNQLAL